MSPLALSLVGIVEGPGLVPKLTGFHEKALLHWAGPASFPGWPEIPGSQLPAGEVECRVPAPALAGQKGLDAQAPQSSQAEEEQVLPR